MSDFKVSYECGDYPTNELSSNEGRKVKTKEDKEWEERLRQEGYHQDSTGCWYHPSRPSVFGEDV